MNWMPAFLGSGGRPAFSSRTQLFCQSAYDFPHPRRSLHPSHPYVHLTDFGGVDHGGSGAPSFFSFGSRAKSKDVGWAYHKAWAEIPSAKIHWTKLPLPELSSDEADCDLLIWHDNKEDISPSPWHVGPIGGKASKLPQRDSFSFAFSSFLTSSCCSKLSKASL